MRDVDVRKEKLEGIIDFFVAVFSEVDNLPSRQLLENVTVQLGGLTGIELSDAERDLIISNFSASWSLV